MVPPEGGSGLDDDLPGGTGTRLQHYRILEPLGAGGTGPVYRARDERSGLLVAIKLFAPSLTGDDGARARFLQEAEAAAGLDHPNIGSILSVEGRDGGAVFLVLTLYEGSTLEARIRGGPLSEALALGLGSQAAAGLAHAHERGIVHRDVKPANVFVTDEGVVKVLDFGIAKVVGVLHAADSGRVAGTVPYMSPEQISGRPVDPRTDVWSLGVVLYEMMAGRRPFQAPRRSDVLDSILHDDPLPLSASRPDVRAETSRLVEKALLRQPEARWTMAELHEALEALAREPGSRVAVAVAGRGAEPSVLILAFASLEPCPEDELFARGLTEAVIADLSVVAGLRVVSRTAGAGVRASSARIRAACAEMGVDYLLEGSVQRNEAGDFGISARLVEVRTDFLAWSGRADAKNVLKTREALAGGVATALGLG